MLFLVFDSFINVLVLRALTAPLPGGHELWLALPLVASFLGALWVGRMVWTLWGETAGVISGLLLVAVSRSMLVTYVNDAFHWTTWLSTIALAAVVLGLARDRLDRRRLIAVGVLVGINAASDPLLLATGVLPFTLAIVVMSRQRGDQRGAVGPREGWWLVVAATVAAVLTLCLMYAGGVRFWRGTSSATLAEPTTVLANLLRAGASLLDLFGLGAAEPQFGRYLVVSGTAGMLALGLALTAVWSATRSALRSPALELRGWVVFWSAGAVCVTAGFVLTRLGGPGAARYLAPWYYAAAALVPLLLTSRRRQLVVGMVAAGIMLGNGLSLPSLVEEANARFERVKALGAVLTVNHLESGLAGWDDALPVWWATRGRATPRAVEQGAGCGRQDQTLCPYLHLSASSWYGSGQDFRYVVLDRGACICLRHPPAGLDPPERVITSGDWTILVYSRDQSSRLVSPPP